MSVRKNIFPGMILIVIGIVLIFPSRVSPFPKDSRRQIIKDAMVFCPGYLREYLKRHEKEILKASQSFDAMKLFQLERYDMVKSGELVFCALVAELNRGNAACQATARRFGLLANFWWTVWVLGGFQPGKDSTVKAISHK